MQIWYVKVVVGSSCEILNVAGVKVIKDSNVMSRSLVFNLNILRNHRIISKQESCMVGFAFNKLTSAVEKMDWSELDLRKGDKLGGCYRNPAKT